jgi:CO dehydrogenase maturation factor
MKIAVTGKGGVGKTTIAALLIQELADRGLLVYAIDADPDANLASMLGFPDADRIKPIIELKSLIKERVGATSEEIGAYFTMNPRVDDIPEEYGVRMGNIRLLVMGHLPKARGGCACPENILVRELVSHALTQDDEVVILDMEAGIEHLGRGTAQGVDLMLIVVEPSRQSVETAQRIRKLASDLGVPRIAAVLNKVGDDDEHRQVEAMLKTLEIVAVLPYDLEFKMSSLQEEGVKITNLLKSGIEEIVHIISLSD